MFSVMSFHYYLRVLLAMNVCSYEFPAIKGLDKLKVFAVQSFQSLKILISYGCLQL